MIDKETRINIGISAVIYLIWHMSDRLFLFWLPSYETIPLFSLAGGVYMLFKCGKPLLFPTTMTALYAVTKFAAWLFNLLTTGDITAHNTDFWLLDTLLSTNADTLTFIFNVLTEYITMLMIFGSAFIAGLITEKILNKKST